MLRQRGADSKKRGWYSVLGLRVGVVERQFVGKIERSEKLISCSPF